MDDDEKEIRPLTPGQLVNVMVGKYDGRELQPVPGLTDDRYAAYRLPSRVGNWLHYPDGHRERVEV